MINLLPQFQTLVSIKEGMSAGQLHSRREISFLSFVTENMEMSKSQIFQDLWVLFETNFKRNGFFVECGICDGIKLSNTVLLERAFGWTGIVAEPARFWHDALFENRNCCISTKCVYGKTGERITFNETNERELSTIDAFSQSDAHAGSRESGDRYEVDTISLRDLLIERDAPRKIDYLSIDTEGSEFDILCSFNFDDFDIKLLSVEHNYTEQREKISRLLKNNGYRRVLSNLSMFDDWYVKS